MDIECFDWRKEEEEEIFLSLSLFIQIILNLERHPISQNPFEFVLKKQFELCYIIFRGRICFSLSSLKKFF